LQGLQTLRSDFSGGTDWLRHCPLPDLHGATLLHRLHRSVPGATELGDHADFTAQALMEMNDKPPYRWHVVCESCSKVTLARPCNVPGEIKPIEHNPVIKCQHCDDTRQYLTNSCFLAPLSVTGAGSDRAGGTIAVVAGLIAAVKLARVESVELENRSPRVRSAISDSITIAKMVIAETKARQ
jgi:hypothetical protein